MTLRLILGQILLIYASRHAQALQVNATIDDQLGDSLSGALPAYVPQNVWTRGDTCTTCFAQPDYQYAFQHTWHDATWEPLQPELTATVSFTGTAVYAYCILANTYSNSYTTFTNLSFSIDGSQVGTFSHIPDGSSSFLYNTLVYSNTSIPNGTHTFVLRAPTGTNNSLVLFDYVQYTFDSNTPTTITSSSSQPISPTSIPAATSSLTATSKSSTPVGAIVGGAVGGLVILALLGIMLVLCRRRRSPEYHSTTTSQPLDEPSSAYTMNGSGTAQSGWREPESRWATNRPTSSLPVSSQSHIRTASGEVIPAAGLLSTSTFDPYSGHSSDTSANPVSLSQEPFQRPPLVASNPDLTLSGTPHPNEKAGLGELSHQLENRQQQLAALESKRSIRYPSTNHQPTSSASGSNTVNDPALEAQVDELKREVERLRQIMLEGQQAPPEYWD